MCCKNSCNLCILLVVDSEALRGSKTELQFSRKIEIKAENTGLTCQSEYNLTSCWSGW